MLLQRASTSQTPRSATGSTSQNPPWRFEDSSLRWSLNLQRVSLLNDLAGYHKFGIKSQPEETVEINASGPWSLVRSPLWPLSSRLATHA
jgi:hypothetical protein